MTMAVVRPHLLTLFNKSNPSITLAAEDAQLLRLYPRSRLPGGRSAHGKEATE